MASLCRPGGGRTTLAAVSFVASGAFMGSGAFGCTAIVDSEDLGAGDNAQDCSKTEKLCSTEPRTPGAPQVCVDATSPDNGCGASECTACQLPGAIARCTQAGDCGISICEEGYADCDGREDNGCEVNLLLDADHCGECGKSCGLSGGSADCAAGACQVVFCQAPYKDCDGLHGNGCEVNTDVDPEHCGACGNGCEGACEVGQCL